mmetsp:Transcript_19527/g.24605  ORF Transcript_19527/g.24605 Transcript_19527/m.24605 type:complete len:784 (-) Transcript_19527:259-2610(-)
MKLFITLSALYCSSFFRQGPQFVSVNAQGNCPAPTPTPDRCSNQGIQDLEQSFDDGIQGLVDARNEIQDVDPEGEFTQEVKDQILADLQENICDLQTKKADTVQKTREACAEIENNDRRLSLMIEGERSLVTTPEQVCGTNEVSAYQGFSDAIGAMYAVIAVLEVVKAVLTGAAEGAGSIPIFGDVGEGPLKVAVAVLDGIIAVLQAVINQLDLVFSMLGVRDDDCIYKTLETTHDVSFETLRFLEDDTTVKIDEIMDETLPRHERKADILDTNVDENQDLLLQQGAPLPRSLVTPTRLLLVNEGHRQLQQLQARADVIMNRAGCDGIDNDGDSILLSEPAANAIVTDDSFTVTIRDGLVDECDEDQVPPTITLLRDPPEDFDSLDLVREWYTNQDNIGIGDDCVPKTELLLTTRFEGDDNIVVRVEDPRCANAQTRNEDVNDSNNDNNIVQGVIVDTSGAFFAERAFAFVIADTEAPVVTCEFNKRQDLFHVVNPPPGFVPDGTVIPPFPDPNLDEPLHIDARNEDGQKFVDVGLLYTVTDNSGADITVDIELFSNEFEDGDGPEMFKIIERNDLANPIANPAAVDFVHRAMFFLSPFSCKSETKRNEMLKNEGKLCVAENNNQNAANPNFPITTRFYDIIITATDKKGNAGETSCTVIVVPDNEEHYPGPGKGGTNKSKCLNGKGKGGCVLPDPNNLVDEYNISQKRFKIGTFSHVWDLSLNADTTRPPLPTPPPSKGKGKSKNRRRGNKNIRLLKEQTTSEASKDILEDTNIVEWKVNAN